MHVVADVVVRNADAVEVPMRAFANKTLPRVPTERAAAVARL